MTEPAEFDYGQEGSGHDQEGFTFQDQGHYDILNQQFKSNSKSQG